MAKKTIRCPLCGGKLIKKVVSKYHTFQKETFFVENVPADICEDCGERYYHAKTLEAIDEMIRSGEEENRVVELKVYEFSTAE